MKITPQPARPKHMGAKLRLRIDQAKPALCGAVIRVSRDAAQPAHGHVTYVRSSQGGALSPWKHSLVTAEAPAPHTASHPGTAP